MTFFLVGGIIYIFIPNKLGYKVTLLISVQEVPCSNLSWGTDYPTYNDPF
jgi:hypothetical protein